ncbi:HEPN domain-containing protein [Corallococcus sp. AB018]|uniref:HEPN domain-containing protein n=1 Tax=Corallococcus sp. AB018 TaxID=2316715 RepID=UPI000F8657FC|nr:HEPN domain-containing protein [Corallococcus sp. AB018]
MPALQSLRDSLDLVRDIANDIDANALAALASAAVRARHDTIQCASVVLLSGYFESFLKQLAEETVVTICSLGAPFSTLDKRIREAHFEHGGRVLQEVSKAARSSRPHDWVKASSADIARRLHSVSSPSGYEIVWEAFADTKANPGVDVVRDFLLRFGVQDGWDKIATHCKVTKSWAETALTNLIAIRNECAHTGRVSVIPSPSELRQFCDYLENLAEAIAALIQAHLNQIQKLVAPTPTPAATSTGGP